MTICRCHMYRFQLAGLGWLLPQEKQQPALASETDSFSIFTCASLRLNTFISVLAICTFSVLTASIFLSGVSDVSVWCCGWNPESQLC